MPYTVYGEPRDLASAEALAQHDRYQFEWGALGLIDARPAQDKKKGADSGIDGVIKFFDDKNNTPKTILVQVKSGKVSVRDIRDLKGVLEREKAAIGVLITLQPPTKPMQQEATLAGFYEPAYAPPLRYPRLQILTTEELLSGAASVAYPSTTPTATFKRAPRQRAPRSTQPTLPGFGAKP